MRMTDDAMEKAFSDYLDPETHDEAEDALFAMIRAAFRAGWEARKAHANTEH